MGDTHNGTRIYARTYHNHNSSIGTAQGQSTNFQGDNDVNMSARSTRASSRRGRHSHSEDTLRENSPTNSAVQEDSHTYAIGSKSNSSRTHPPRERFQELVENAATYQLHSSLDPQDPKHSPAPGHYLGLSGCAPGLGHIYRIWKEDDVVMHPNTVVLILAKGRSWQVCKITRCSQNDHSGATFYEEHSKVPEESTDTRTESTSLSRASSRLEPVTVSMNEKQGLEPDVWVNLDESFHMGRPDDYQVTCCGKLTTRSREYAVKKYNELYIG